MAVSLHWPSGPAGRLAIYMVIELLLHNEVSTMLSIHEEALYWASYMTWQGIHDMHRLDKKEFDWVCEHCIRYDSRTWLEKHRYLQLDQHSTDTLLLKL